MRDNRESDLVRKRGETNPPGAPTPDRGLTGSPAAAFFPAERMNLNGTTTLALALAHASVVAASVVSVSVVTDAPRGS